MPEDIVERLRTVFPRSPSCQEAAATIESLRNELRAERRALWLLVKAADGFTVEKADLEDYPGDDRVRLVQETDPSTGTVIFRAETL